MFFIFTICLIVFSKSNIQAVKNSLNIWVNNVIPSLFPFFIATELLNHTNIPRVIGNMFNKIMRPLFNVPGIGAYALFMGIISGYPVGAKIVTNFRNDNLCTKEEAERLRGTGYKGTRPNSTAESMELKAAQVKCKTCGMHSDNGVNSQCDACAYNEKHGLN